MQIQVETHQCTLSETVRQHLATAIKDKYGRIQAAIERINIYVDMVHARNSSRVIQCSLSLHAKNGKTVHVESRGSLLGSVLQDVLRKAKYRFIQKIKRRRATHKHRSIKANTRALS